MMCVTVANLIAGRADFKVRARDPLPHEMQSEHFSPERIDAQAVVHVLQIDLRYITMTTEEVF
jgi:hypothetical protein